MNTVSVSVPVDGVHDASLQIRSAPGELLFARLECTIDARADGELEMREFLMCFDHRYELSMFGCFTHDAERMSSRQWSVFEALREYAGLKMLEYDLAR